MNCGLSGETNVNQLHLPNLPVLKKVNFSSKWLTLWPWLTYEEDSMYCKLCLKQGKKNMITKNILKHRKSFKQHYEAGGNARSQTSGSCRRVESKF